MGGLFGVVSKNNCVTDLFFGVDYHSHLGTKRGGMALLTSNGFERSIHNIENSPFRTKFERDVDEMSGTMGIGCISDTDPQPLIVRSSLGSYAIATVGRIDNLAEIEKKVLKNSSTHFLEMSGDKINQTELTAALINQCGNIVDGIKYAQSEIEGSMTILIMTRDGIYAARDSVGRTPLSIGKKEEEDDYCVSFEPFAYMNLGYIDYKELGPGEIVLMTADGVETVQKPGEKMRICTFLWTYYGYPTSYYEGVSVETMRYRCGAALAARDGDISDSIDLVAGVPDSGTAHAIGYANASKIPFARPFIKYTPTWPRSFTPSDQNLRELIARMKLVPIHSIIEGKRLLLVEDSIVRGTQFRGLTDFLYACGAKELHVRPACPPLLFGCKYLNFTRSKSEDELVTRRVIHELEGAAGDEHAAEYARFGTPRYKRMVEAIGNSLGMTSLEFLSLDKMLDCVGVDRCKLCTYCWNGVE